MMEALKIFVDGVAQNPADAGVLALDDIGTATEDGPGLKINVLQNDQVPDLVKALALASAPAHGTATLVQPAIESSLPVARRKPSAQLPAKHARRAFPGAIQAQMLMATMYELKGQKDKANEYYRKILEINKNFAPAANNLAWNYAEHGGNLDTALWLAQKAREANPNEPSYADTLGWIHYKKRNYDTAVALLKESSENFKNSNPTVLYHLGRAHQKAGQKEPAAEALKRALVLNPNFAEAEDAKRALQELAN